MKTRLFFLYFNEIDKNELKFCYLIIFGKFWVMFIVRPTGHQNKCSVEPL